jgi:hypothetical protein
MYRQNYSIILRFSVKEERRVPFKFVFFFISSRPLIWELAPILEHRADYSVSLIFSEAVDLLRRVISPSEGLYLNTGQHKHRKTRTHITHPCPRRESNPPSRPPRDRRLFMPRTALLQRPVSFKTRLHYCLHLLSRTFFGAVHI